MPREYDPPETSKRAYEEIRANGLLKGMKMRAYILVYQEGPLTGREADRLGGSDNFHKRLSDLEKMGAVSQVGQRICTVSGMLATLWDVTGKLPVALPPVSIEHKGSLQVGIERIERQWPEAVRPTDIKVVVAKLRQALVELQAKPDDDDPDNVPEGGSPESTPSGSDTDVYDILKDIEGQ